MKRTLLIFIILFSCAKKENNQRVIIDKDGTIIFFGDFEERNFKNKKVFKIFQEGIEESKNQDFEKARELFYRALELDNNNKIIYASLGNTESYSGNHEKAISLLQTAYKLDSTYYIAHISMAIVYNRSQEYQKSIDVCNFAIKRSSAYKIQCAAHYNKSIAEFELKNLDSAIYDIQKAIAYCNYPEIIQKFEACEKEWIAERELVKTLTKD